MSGAGGDVWGAILRDAVAGRQAAEIVERDDGFIVSYDAGYVLALLEEWDDSIEREAMAFVRGRVLDIGCGGGRVARHLQEQGHTVVAIDSSPGAVEICSRAVSRTHGCSASRTWTPRSGASTRS